ncbi:fructokinase [Pelagirhabdus alkalitolerans]|uniref:Fructokinase n=1 Tax=Pelagirhabdus alkalitolerans TaxID=1612202 RepID=A0A1G6GPC5_9BACI|nr:sugar kinase [Pelagirhabdus alkalitolerans]SDB83847.1 fructokinase [Pelagirhabdus alkalitolerans]
MFDFDHAIPFQNKPNDLLTMGELLVDMIAKDYSDQLVSGEFERHFGGSPANIAMNVNRLGSRAKLVASVGQDSLGDYLVNQIKQSSLSARLIQRSQKSTSMVVVNKSKGTPIPIFYRGADYDLEMNQELESAIKESKIMHLSSWPISKSKSRYLIEQSISVAKKNKTMICFDPNYHSFLWDEEDGISYIKNLLKHIDIVKPSEDDAERLFGQDTHDNQIDKFHYYGVPFVIMTLGEKGAIVSINGDKKHFEAVSTEVVDTTGAGDAFWSGFYVGLTQNQTIEQALQLGFSVSAFKLKYVGAVVDLPHYTMFDVAEEA